MKSVLNLSKPQFPYLSNDNNNICHSRVGQAFLGQGGGGARIFFLRVTINAESIPHPNPPVYRDINRAKDIRTKFANDIILTQMLFISWVVLPHPLQTSCYHSFIFFSTFLALTKKRILPYPRPRPAADERAGAQSGGPEGHQRLSFLESRARAGRVRIGRRRYLDSVHFPFWNFGFQSL